MAIPPGKKNIIIKKYKLKLKQNLLKDILIRLSVINAK
jgi:hypothetical protein